MPPSPAPLNVLFATSEIYPLVKTGGLADVSASLPEALRTLGADVRVLLPGYPLVMKGLPAKWVAAVGVFEFGEVRILSSVLPSGVPALVVDYPPLFQRDGGPYLDRHGHDWQDNAFRFGLLSRVAGILAGGQSPLEWRPDVLHCNDWQTGLAPAYLHFQPGPRAATVMTIHNLAYQGVFPLATALKLGLPPESMGMEGVEYYGKMSFLKAGLYYSDVITTVSPTYAEEIRTDALGFGMQGLLQQRRESLHGILNGIDVHAWNPEADPHLAAPFGVEHLHGKAENKRALQERLGLKANARIPLLAIVSRLTHQKGLDLVLEAAAELLKTPVQLALLGDGDKHLEQAFLGLEESHPGQVAVHIGYNEGLAHLAEAGADLFLMPSRFEPCGLNQMYSMHYGTPPVVYATGGLADTVVDCTPETLADGTATGFVFDTLTAGGLVAAVRRALDVFKDKKAWQQLQHNGMKADFSWERSAAAYLDLYRKTIQSRQKNG